MLFKESIKRFTPPKGWSWGSIDDVAKLSFSSVDKKSVEGENAVRLCNYMDVFYNRRIREGMPFMVSTASDSDIKKFTLNKGDVVLTKDSETPEEIAFAAVIDEQIDNLVCGYHLAVLRPDKSKVTGEYLMSAINFHPNHHQFIRLANGATRFGLGIDSLNNALLPIPPLAEQRRIAAILRTWDEAIETAEAELKAKQERKRWLTVSLIFSKGMGAKSKAHKYVPIGDFMREDVDSVDPSQSPDEHFELWSIPAHDKGVADYVKGFQVGSHKKLVNPGDVLISKIVPHIQRSRVVGRSERKCRVIASTEWIVFGGGKIEAEYLREVLISEDFHRKFMETITGVGGSLARANVKAVAKIKIPFPSIEEQRKIANVLLCADADASAIARRVESLRTQKRGLMQKLLTGEVRVAA